MAKRFSVILVPYDGSRPSDNAVDYAMELGKMAHSKVIILNVVEELVTRNLTFDKPIMTAKTGEIRNLREYLKELYQELKHARMKILEKKKQEYSELNVELKVVVGRPVESILEAAALYGATLIVIGTTGLSGFSKLKALGSVARGVSERASCPVTLVHHARAAK